MPRCEEARLGNVAAAAGLRFGAKATEHAPDRDGTAPAYLPSAGYILW